MTDTNDKGRFQFITGDKGEIMLLIDTQKDEPFDAAVLVKSEMNTIFLFRGENCLTLENVEGDIFTRLKNKTDLLICEVEPGDNAEEMNIIYTYKAKIIENKK